MKKLEASIDFSSLRVYLLILIMGAIVAVSNYLVQFPIESITIGGEVILTYGALTYPMTFIVNEVCNYWHGKKQVVKVIAFGFFIGIIMSFFLSTPRIAIASGIAFLTAQSLDTYIFSYLEKRSLIFRGFWSAQTAAMFDTILFFSIAFSFTSVPWQTLALGDFFAKFIIDCLMLVPLRFIIFQPWKKLSKPA